jgi:hypothetical protein
MKSKNKDTYQFSEEAQTAFRRLIPPNGAVIMFAGTLVPIGWLECDGRALSRDEYPDLFERIGTVYGNGDGSTTFNIPHLEMNLGLKYIIHALG